MPSKPSKVDELLATVQGRISYRLDYILDIGLPQIRRALALLAMPGQSAANREVAHRHLRFWVRAVGSLCRASRNERMTAEHKERYLKVLSRFRPLGRRIESAGVPIPPVILSELERNPAPKQHTGPRLHALEGALRFLNRWLDRVAELMSRGGPDA